MARNGSGVYTNPYPNFVAGTVISSTEVDANNTQMATALTGSIAADGQTTITGNLPMSTYKFTGLGVGSASTDSANLGQVQAGAYIWCGTMGGAADAGTLSPSPAITAYAAGQRFAWKASTNSNTGAMTVAISGLSTIAVQDDRAALSAGGHVASDIYMGILDTTSTMQIMKVASSSSVPGSSSITTAMLQNSAVTAAKIASDAVETAKINDAAVTTAKINNDAVTLAKMASGTDGNIISYDSSGNPVAIATGNDGQVLTSAGAGAQPAFEDAGGGAWTFLSSVTASNAATAVLTSGFDSTYDQYMIVATDINPATDQQYFQMRTSTDGGSSYDSGGSDYQWVCDGYGADPGAIDTSSNADSIINMVGKSDARPGNGAAEGSTFTMWINNPSGTTYYKNIRWQAAWSGPTAGRPVIVQGYGFRYATTNVDAVQFFMGSGNLDGVFRLYGLADS